MKHIQKRKCCCREQYLTSPRDLHPTKQELCDHLPPIMKTIKIRRTRHERHCWRSRDELVSDVLLWTPSQGREKAGCPTRTYIQQFCADTGCSQEDLTKEMDDREGWRERVRNIRADSVIRWWWWYIYIYIYIYISLKCADSTNFLWLSLTIRPYQSSLLTSSVCTVLINEIFCWSARTGESMCSSSWKNFDHEFDTAQRVLFVFLGRLCDGM